MVSPYANSHCIFSIIDEGANAWQFEGYYLFRVIIRGRPSTT